MLMKLQGCTTRKVWMRFKEFALKVFMVFIKAENYRQNNKLTYEHRSTYRGLQVFMVFIFLFTL